MSVKTSATQNFVTRIERDSIQHPSNIFFMGETLRKKETGLLKCSCNSETNTSELQEEENDMSDANDIIA